MGGIFSLLNNGIDVSGVVIDFDAAPNDKERSLVQELAETLALAKAELKTYENYKDCNGIIRKAMGDPTPANLDQAFNEVHDNVVGIKELMNTADKLAVAFVKTIRSFTNNEDEKQGIQEQPATARIFAEILDIVMQFDEIKMRTPGLQNDFSYYRRNLSKHSEKQLTVREEDANYISLFIAQASPLMHRLVEKLTSETKNDEVFSQKVQKLIATISNVCLHLVKNNLTPNEEISMLCVRAMVGTIVVYDKTFSEGAFSSSSGINFKGAVTLVCKNYAKPRTLVNALQYATVHLHDETTPSSIATMLDNA